MKKVFLFISFLFCIYVLSAQEMDVPQKVLESFSAQCSSSDDVIWTFNGENFVAEHYDEFEKVSYFNTEGQWLKTITYTMEDDLEKRILNLLSDKYENYYVESIQTTELSEGLIFHEIILMDDDDEKIILRFDEKWNLQ